MQINKIIEAEAERLWNEQWQESAQEYAHEETKTYKPETKDMCFYERVFGFERGVQVGFQQGAHFALSIERWIEIKEGCEMPERSGRYLAWYRNGGADVLFYSHEDKCFFDENSNVADISHYQLIQPPKNK